MFRVFTRMFAFRVCTRVCAWCDAHENKLSMRCKHVYLLVRKMRAQHIYTHRAMPLQFGVWGGAQLYHPPEDCMSALFSCQHMRTIVSVHDGSTYSVFINCNPVGRLEARFNFPDNGQVAVGEDARHDGRLLRGKVYALQLWDVALSEDQVRLASSAMAARLPL